MIHNRDKKADPAPWRALFVWAERLVTFALLAFVAVRLAPQLQALTGVGPDHGQAPAISVVTLRGNTVLPTDLRGKVVVVNFWATWCHWCRWEMPSLEKLHEAHAGDDLVVIGLATDVGSAGPIRSFLSARHITYPVARATAAVERAFGGVTGIPTTFVLDRTGVVRYRVVGYFAPPALEAAVSRLLNEPRPAQETRHLPSESD